VDKPLFPTSHAIDRWIQRYEPGIGRGEAEEHLVKAFNRAEEIGSFDCTGTIFFMDSDYRVYVTDTNTIITVFTVDYGLPEDINQNIADALLKKIRRAKAGLSKTQAKRAETMAGYEASKAQLTQEIEVKETALRRVEALEQALEEEAKAEEGSLHLLVRQLADSMSFRVEYASIKRGTNGKR
jgi:hypothetical protein